MRRLALLLVGCMICGCTDQGPPVEIVVPKDFVGNVWLVKDRNASEIPLENGKYVVRIPEIGVIRVRSFRPFNRFHVEHAAYDDGTRIPTRYQSSDTSESGTKLESEAVALSGGQFESRTSYKNGVRSEVEYMRYFIGPKDSLAAYDDRIPGIDR